MTMRELTDTILNEVLSLNAQEYGSLSGSARKVAHFGSWPSMER